MVVVFHLNIIIVVIVLQTINDIKQAITLSAINQPTVPQFQILINAYIDDIDYSFDCKDNHHYRIHQLVVMHHHHHRFNHCTTTSTTSRHIYSSSSARKTTKLDLFSYIIRINSHTSFYRIGSPARETVFNQYSVVV